jgi:hypothetical protein
MFGPSATIKLETSAAGAASAEPLLESALGAVVIFDCRCTHAAATLASEVGVIPRSCSEIMEALIRRRQQLGIEFKVGASYVEVPP